MAGESSTDPKVIAGAVAIAVGLIIMLLVVTGGDTDEDDSGDLTAACTLTAGGVTAIATGLTRNRTAAAIMATTGASLSSMGCARIVDRLVMEPEAQQTVLVDLGGQTEQVNVTAFDFTPPAPRQQTCLDWILQSWREQCLAGTLAPPPAF